MARIYRSSQRERSAALTRAAILEVAESLFVSEGYSATTIADIARRADVALPTVYGSVGNKAQIVLALIEGGTSDPGIALTATRVRQSARAETAIAQMAAGVCESIQKLLPLVAVMYDTAPTEPLIADAVKGVERTYRQNLSPLVQHLREHAWLRDDLSDADAIDILWFYFGVQSLRSLHASGWSWERIEAWLAEQAGFALLRAGV
jgi:AcrR family transcriptional regulator